MQTHTTLLSCLSPALLLVMIGCATVGDSAPGSDTTVQAPRVNSADEIVTARTMHSATYESDDGKRLTRISPQALHYADDEGRWHPIDTAIVTTGDAGFPFENTTNTLQSRFGSGVHDGVELRTGAHRLSWATRAIDEIDDQPEDRSFGSRMKRGEPRWQPGSVRAITSGVEFPLGTMGVERWSVEPGRLKHDVILDSPPDDWGTDLSVWGELVLSEGLAPAPGGERLEAFSTRGEVPIVDEEGRSAFLIEAPVAYEQADSSETIPLTWRFTHRDDGVWSVTLLTPLDWLLDPARAYPVVLDPTVTLGSGGTRTVRKTGDCASGPVDSLTTALRVGLLDNSGPPANGLDCNRTVFRFGTGAIPDAATVTRVELNAHVLFNTVGDIDLAAVSTDPLSATDAAMWSEAAPTAPHYVSDYAAPGTSNWFGGLDLGAQAATDLQAGLASDWFAISAHRGDHAAEFASGDGSGHTFLEMTTEGKPKQPVLYVTYDTGFPDDDGDGVDTSTDCDDSPATGVSCSTTCQLFYADRDNDGYGDATDSLSRCIAPAFYVANGTDCDDGEATAHPGGTEVADDDIDQDCSGVDRISCFFDWDRDGFGTTSATVVYADDGSCDTAQQESAVATDCQDFFDTVHPGAPDPAGDGIDQNCNGVDTKICVLDADQDTFGNKLGITVEAPDGTCDIAERESNNATDCNDTLDAIFPGAPDLPGDGIDQDCNGFDTVTCILDADRDGYGTKTGATRSAPDGSCDTADQESTVATDCVDSNAAIHPGAVDIPEDTVDQDCNGFDTIRCVVDADKDGYGTQLGTIALAADGTCHAAQQESSTADDCNDAVAAIHPTATDTPDDSIDQDCSGADTITCAVDDDGDGFGHRTATTLATDGTCDTSQGESRVATDCDDALATAYPNAPEVVGDTIDQDCSGTDSIACTVDADGDGYGAVGGDTVIAPDASCDALEGESATSDDCDDADPAVSPAAVERCDTIDNDCDDVTDESDAIDAPVWYADTDSDGHGDANNTTPACEQPSGYVDSASDCNDADATITFGADEIPYDGIDQDCNGSDLCDVDGDGYKANVGSCTGADCADGLFEVHLGATEVANGRDDDCDGLVDEQTDQADEDRDGFTPAGGDCNDANPDVNPAMVEDCNRRDDDCDGEIDEDTVCADDDGDGFCEGQDINSDGIDDCTDGSTAGDCNDSDGDAWPGAGELVGDGFDNDCDGVIDNGIADVDGDGYTADDGDPATVDGGDCAPTDPAIHPGAVEIFDGIDNDCDTEVDEGTVVFDDDEDGYCEGLDLDADGSPDCSDGSTPGDCNDRDATVHPAADEVFNGTDDDCDGVIDSLGRYYDEDDDGFSEVEGDCDDDDPDVYPGQYEFDNGIDDDCDGIADDPYIDLDDDGWTAAAGDCNDEDGWIHPGEYDLCDQLDNDCDGTIDENCGDPDVVEVVDPVDDTGCSHSGAAVGWWWLLLLGVAGRRRR